MMYGSENGLSHAGEPIPGDDDLYGTLVYI